MPPNRQSKNGIERRQPSVNPSRRLNVFITAKFAEHRNTANAENKKYQSTKDTNRMLTLLIRTLMILAIIASGQTIAAAASPGICKAYWVANDDGQVSRRENKSEIEKRHSISCSTSCERAMEIYDNCIVNLMPNRKVEITKRKAIWGKCQRAACNPTFFDNLQY